MCLLNWVLSANSVPYHQYDIFVSWTVATWRVKFHFLVNTLVHNGSICASCKNIISIWKLHIDCFQHCTCFVETLLKIAYKRTLNYMFMLFVLRLIISVIVDWMHTFIFQCFNNLSVGKIVYCYEIHSVFSWPMLTMWNDVFWRHSVRFYYWTIFFNYLKQERESRKAILSII